MKKNQELILEIESLAFGGDGVARHEGVVAFVKGGLPGQRVRAQITRKRKSHGYARILEVLDESEHAVAPRCAHFEDCGGCVLQHLDYPQQVVAKTAQVREALERLGGFEDPNVRPALPAPEPFHYRNKMEYTFSDRRWLPQRDVDSGAELGDRNFALGLHIRGRYEKILSIDACHLQSETGDAIRNFVAQATAGSEFKPYTTRDHTGFWRFLVIREGKNTGQRMVILVTADRGDAGRSAAAALLGDLARKFPETTSVIHATSTTKAQVARGDRYDVLHGSDHIIERLGDFEFRISPESFFQTNTKGAEQLYSEVARVADLQGHETVYDLYCGAGTIGIWLSRRARHVVGIEVVPKAVQDAADNATRNGVENCTFHAGDLKDLMLQADGPLTKHAQPDLVVFDPPRAGLHPDVVAETVRLTPPRILYVSCNPTTFARDAAMFCEGGYRLAHTRPVDMFPHTAHIELISLLERSPDAGPAPA